MWKKGFLILSGYVLFCFSLAGFGSWELEHGNPSGIIPLVTGLSWGTIMPLMAVIRGWLDD
jgi:hypothetical protein